MGLATPPIDVVLRLADEGVPLRAIARAVDIPSENVRDCLYQAKHDGRLIDLPREDWPPGFPRDERALQLSRLVGRDREAITRAIGKLFGLTATETKVLLALLQLPAVARERSGMGDKSMDVHIHHLRSKLASYNISIETVWAYGYQLSTQNREAATALILRHVAALPSL
jgi:hypothetical protein